MTAGQLTLGDCDPAWNALLTRRPDRPRLRDLRGQRISRSPKHRIVDVHVVGDWL